MSSVIISYWTVTEAESCSNSIQVRCKTVWYKSYDHYFSSYFIKKNNIAINSVESLSGCIMNLFRKNTWLWFFRKILLLFLCQLIHSNDLVCIRLCLSSVERFPSYVDIFLSRTTGQIFTVLVSNTFRERNTLTAVDLVLGLKLLKDVLFYF